MAPTQDATDTDQPTDFSPEEVAMDDDTVIALRNAGGYLSTVEEESLTTRERARLTDLVDGLETLERLVFARRLRETEARQDTETFEADVYFHEGDEAAYFVAFDAHDPARMALAERLESQLGEAYERAVDPGEKIYVGRLSYTLDADDAVADWHFNRIPATNLGVPLDGQSYDEETAL